MGILSIKSIMLQLNIYKLLYGSNRLERRRKLGLALVVIPEGKRALLLTPFDLGAPAA